MKKASLLCLSLFVSFILFVSPVWGQDIAPPELVSIDMTPTSVDVSSAPADITVTVQLTDDSSGVASWSITFLSPSGTQTLEISAFPGLVDGTTTGGTFEGTGTLPQGSEEGAWVANILTVTDVEGNTADINLSSYGIFLIQVGSTLEDLTPPDLVSIEVTPTVVDVTAGDAQAVVSAHLTDDLSGVSSGSHIAFVSPSGRHTENAQFSENVSGTLLDGIFEGTLYFNQYTEPGVWQVQTCTDYTSDPPREFHCMYVNDQVNNSATIDLDAKGISLEIEVISPPEDLTSPDVVSIEVTPTVVDVTAGDAQAVVSAHLTDDLSGVSSGSHIAFVSPSGRHTENAQFSENVSGTLLDGIFEGTLYFNQYTEPGVWQVQTCTDYTSDPPREFHCMYVNDQVNNSATIDLDAKGISLEIEVISPKEDVLPPEFHAMSATPTVIDISEADAQAVVSAHLTDDLSGVSSGSHIAFVSPSGRHTENAQFSENVSGTLLDGIFEGTLYFNQYTEPGVWQVQTCTDYTSDPPREFHCMYVNDQINNSATIDLDKAGNPLTFGVVAVPLELLFSLEPFSAVNEVGSPHTVTATISQDAVPIQDAEVIFEIIKGPHQGVTESVLTDTNGQAFFIYTGTTVGVDSIIASVDTDGDGEIDAARQATKEWAESSNESPEAICTDVAVSTEPGICIASASVDAGSSDPDDDPITLTQTPAGPYGLGATNVTLTVTDDKSATDSCISTVTVEDQESPRVTCPEPIVLECADPAGTTAAFSTSAEDNCSSGISASCAPASDSLFPVGESSITCNATDESGNSNSCIFGVSVQDSTAPVPDVTTLLEIRGECSASIAVTPTATDACTGTITGTTTDPLEYTEPGTYTVTWTYTDNSGNGNTQTQTVVVKDTTPPVPDVANLPEVRGESSAAITSPPTATDACNGSIIGTTTDPLEYNEPGSYTVTWTYIDSTGNESIQTQAVVVEGITPPETTAKYKIIDLNSIDEFSSFNGISFIAINDFGHLIGRYSPPGSSITRPFIYDGTTFKDIQPPGTLSYINSSAYDVNNHGHVVGEAHIIDNGGAKRCAFYYDGTTSQKIIPPEGTYTSGNNATAINDLDYVVGGIDLQCSGSGCYSRLIPFIYHGGNFEYLLHKGMDTAISINNFGLIAGNCEISRRTHACLYDGSFAQDLGTLPGLDTSRAIDMNNIGQIVGSSGRPPYFPLRAFLWDSENGMMDLGGFGGNYSSAYAINDLGQIVGVSDTDENLRRSFLYENGEMHDLNNLIVDWGDWDPNGLLTSAVDINNNGEILGSGTTYGELHYFLLIPTNNQTPTTPILSSPTNGATDINPASVVLSWSPSTDPDGEPVEYCVTVNEDSSPDDIPIFTGCDNEIFTTDTSFTLPDPLEPDKTYFWAVWARDDQGNWSPASAWWSFSTTSPNEPPMIDSFVVERQCDAGLLAVKFDCLGHDPDGEISGYTVDFGDGNTPETSDTGVFYHTYTGRGEYSASCTAVDNEGGQSLPTEPTSYGENETHTGSITVPIDSDEDALHDCWEFNGYDHDDDGNN